MGFTGTYLVPSLPGDANPLEFDGPGSDRGDSRRGRGTTTLGAVAHRDVLVSDVGDDAAV